MILLDPARCKDNSDAVTSVLFELIRYKNSKQQADITDAVEKGTKTPEQGAEEAERLTHNYMKEHQTMVEAAIKAKDWTITNDGVKEVLDKYPIYADYLRFAKFSGHYGAKLAYYKGLAPKK